jgi:hypothetical protein
MLLSEGRQQAADERGSMHRLILAPIARGDGVLVLDVEGDMTASQSLLNRGPILDANPG